MVTLPTSQPIVGAMMGVHMPDGPAAALAGSGFRRAK